jgi:hypothetical protein
MFIFIYVALVCLASFIPFIMVFISWDISILDINWEFVFLMLRLNVVISALVGLSFTLSKDGKEFADEFNVMIADMWKKGNK